MKNTLHLRRAQLSIAILALAPHLAFAEQSLSEAVTNQLAISGRPCFELTGGADPTQFLTGGLLEICSRAAPLGAVSNGQGPSAGNTQNLASEAQALAKSARGEQGDSQSLGGNWSIFATAEQESLDRDVSRLEDAFDSSATRFNAGINYAVSADTQLGVAVVSTTHEGDFHQGGSFNSDSLGVRVIADIGLGGESFLQLLLGRDSVSSDRTRVSNFFDVLAGSTIYTVKATPASEFDYDQNEAAVVLGTHWSVGSATLSPVLGLNWLNSDYGTYQESGNSGLELTTHDDSRESLQGIIGLQSSWAVSTSWGVWAPQVGATFKNEFEDKARQVQVSFNGDRRAKRFTYDVEEGDRNFLTLSAGSVFVLKNGWQFYLNAETDTANDLYSRTLVSTGLRCEL